MKSDNLQEGFAPCRGSSTGVVAQVEGLWGGWGESTWQVEGLSPEGDASRFESLLAQSFGE